MRWWADGLVGLVREKVEVVVAASDSHIASAQSAPLMESITVVEVEDNSND